MSWSLRRSPCWQEFIGLENLVQAIITLNLLHVVFITIETAFQETENGDLQNYFDSPNSIKNKEGSNYTNVEYIKSKEMTFPCDGSANPIVMVICIITLNRNV